MDSGEESDFEGFTAEQIQEANDRLQRSNIDNESDIDIEPDLLSDSESESGDDEDQDDIDVDFVWSENLHDIRSDPFTAQTGVNHNLNDDARPLDYFHLYLPPHFFDTLAQETNRYAQQKIAQKADPLWTDTNAAEMKAFFAINIMMGIKQLPQIWCYWSEDERYRCNWISSTMSKTRFMKLSQYIHLRDTSNQPQTGQPGYDPLYKVRPLLDMVEPLFMGPYKPAQNLSLDEGMVGFKGRLFFKQYMPAKPTKWGIKIWQLCESDSGYCLLFDVYTGKAGNPQQRARVQGHGLGYDVVWRLSGPYQGLNHHLYYDRYFSSVKLASDLLDAKTYITSTIMANRKELPQQVKKLKLKNQGECKVYQKNNLGVTVYKDKRQITMLSSGEKPTLPQPGAKPDVILNYNKYMGGVDKADQLRSYYPVGRAGHKWWRYLMWYVVNVSIVNAWILWSKTPNHIPAPTKDYDHLRFRADIADQLRGGFTSRKHRKGRRSALANIPVAVESIGQHKCVKIEGRKKVCRQCSKRQKKTPSGGQVQTSYKCDLCDLPLCRVGCFTQYHDENMV